jgi:hypothetical protein
MEVGKAKNFIDDVMNDDYFAMKSEDWYNNDTVLILTPNELEELNIALKEWVSQNNIIRVQNIARISNDIQRFLEETRNDEGGR